MKFLRSLIENKNTVELTQSPAEKDVSAAWHEGVLYRGTPIFSIVYDNDDVVKTLTNYLAQQAEEDGIVNFDSQECYLGYLPSKDVFIMGFDTWGENDDQDYYDEDDENSTADNSMAREIDNVIAFKIGENGRIGNAKILYDVPGRMFYGRGVGHEFLKKKYPDLIDIRLD